MDIDLLRALNPGAAFAAGDTIAVAVVGAPRTATVNRVETRRGSGEVIAFAKDWPSLPLIQPRSEARTIPLPPAITKSTASRAIPNMNIIRNQFPAGQEPKKLELPSGPNNSGGTVWIDLSEPTYGIHCTPEPDKIDKAGSHGCVRLTNGHAEELASMVKSGVEVDFVR